MPAAWPTEGRSKLAKGHSNMSSKAQATPVKTKAQAATLKGVKITLTLERSGHTPESFTLSEAGSTENYIRLEMPKGCKPFPAFEGRSKAHKGETFPQKLLLSKSWLNGGKAPEPAGDEATFTANLRAMGASEASIKRLLADFRKAASGTKATKATKTEVAAS